MPDNLESDTNIGLCTLTRSLTLLKVVQLGRLKCPNLTDLTTARDLVGAPMREKYSQLMIVATGESILARGSF